MNINLKKLNILIVGSGYMAEEYIKVLISQKIKFELVGNTDLKVKRLSNKYKKKFYSGGIDNFKKFNNFTHAIICVNEEKIFNCVRKVLNSKVKNILVEKPGAKNFKEINYLKNLAKKMRANLFVAYNRRFYETIDYIKKIIIKDKGIISADFSFTEWKDKIKKIKYKNYIFKNWFFYNSLHLIDLVFYLIGEPKKISSYTGKKEKPFKDSIYVGSGVTKKNIFFSYHSNWSSSGRWSINLYTKKRKIILAPLEKIMIQKKNKTNIEEINFKRKFDNKFKPGLYNLIKSFLSRNNKKIQNFENYSKSIRKYIKISKYNF